MPDIDIPSTVSWESFILSTLVWFCFHPYPDLYSIQAKEGLIQVILVGFHSGGGLGPPNLNHNIVKY